MKEESQRKKNIEKKVADFYDEIGWSDTGSTTEDAHRFEDLRECAREYVSKCRLRVLKHIPSKGENILDVGSGPVQYPEYVLYSKEFVKRYCIELSSVALKIAESKIGENGVYLHGSFLDIPLEENFFDCSISLHTIYHINKDLQEAAVRKLIRVTKPDQPVIIVYINPNHFWAMPLRCFIKIKKIFSRGHYKERKDEGLYFHAYPLKWWLRFKDIADVHILPWRSFETDMQKKLMPNNRIGKRVFNMLFALEEQFPNFFVNFFQYPMVILRKK